MTGKITCFIISVLFFCNNLTAKNSKVVNINDYLEVENTFLLPNLGTTQSFQIISSYCDKQLLFVTNQLSMKEDSISFDLFLSNSNKKFDKVRLVFPNYNFSKHLFIYDLIKSNNKYFFLIDKVLLVFDKQGEVFSFIKMLQLTQNCNSLVQIKDNIIYLTSELYSSNKNSNFIYSINTHNGDSKTTTFEDTKYKKLVNIGPRHNKVYLDDSTVIYSDILNYRLFFESKSKKNAIDIKRKDWKSAVEKFSKNNIKSKTLKGELMDNRTIIDTHSSIFNLFALNNMLFVQYKFQDPHKDMFLDIYSIDRVNKKLTLIAKKIKTNIDKDALPFSINDMGLSLKIKPQKDYLLELVKFPFPRDKVFKDYNRFETGRASEILSGGSQYSIVVRKAK